MAIIKLAEALLRRKELQQKVDRLKEINKENLFEVKVSRQAVTENIENVVASVPKIKMQQVTHCFDWHSKQLRKIDAAIQNANWNTEIEVDDQVIGDYIDPFVE